MFRRMVLGICLTTLLPFGTAEGQPAVRYQLRDGDRVVLLGNALVEQEQFHGYLETRLLRHFPEAKLTFRNLGWGGDTVRGSARTSGYQNPEGMARLLKEVQAQKPTLVILGYGMNESFDGPQGLPAFVRDFGKLLDQLRPLGARVVILSPSFHEDHGRPLPDPAAHNQDLERYTAALRQLAQDRGLPFVDLFHPLAEAGRAAPHRRLTSNGILLNEYGYWLVAEAVERQLGLPALGWRVELDASGKVQSAQGATPTDVTAGPRGVRFRLADSPLLAPLPPGGRAGEESPLLRVTGLPPGQYVLKVDGREVLAASSADWDRGVRVTTGPLLETVEKLRQAIVRRNELFYRRWRPFNDHSRHWGYIGGDFKLYDDLVADQERVIERCRHVPAPVLEVSASGGPP